MNKIKLFIFTAIFTLLLNSFSMAQQAGSLQGQVFDALGAVVVGAQVIVVDAGGRERSSITNQQGEFNIAGLAPGNYIVRVVAANFGLYENTAVRINAGQREELIVTLTIESVQEEVEVSGDNQISTDNENNAGATVLRGQDLEALPDDPDELEAALQALAGPSAGPGGGQIYIDGFTGGRLPPREAIREIRINQNPFSAEYERLGFGRIEILTRPGSDRWRGQAFLNFNDESLNSRNPFAINRASSQVRFYGGNISGPVQKGKSSFFLDVSNREIDNSAIVNALILNPSLNIVPFREEFAVPNRRLSISPRFDYQINTNNTLVARYSFTRFTSDNQGISEFSLPSRAFQTSSTEHEFRLTETMIVNPKTINETRFQYTIRRNEQVGDNSIPTIQVPAAFTGGGAQVGFNFNRENFWELTNNTTTTMGRNSQHTIKFGVRIRGNHIDNRSEGNYGGTFTFPGFFAAGDPFDLNNDGIVSPIEQYRARVMGAENTRYIPSQFSISTGDPLAQVSRYDVGAFISDDWRVNQKLTLGFGLRYENQTNISDNLNFAPRFSFAYSPGAGGARRPKTVFRGGFGIFFDRFSENLTLQAIRFDGTRQLNLLVNANDPDPVRRQISIDLLSQPVFGINGVTNVPTAAQILSLLPQSNVIRQVAPDLKSPYTIQTALGVERQLPFNTTMAVFYIAARSLHQLRSRNINAPICELGQNCLNAPRPDPTRGNVYQFESSGISNQHQMIVNFRTMLNPNFTLFGNYRLGYVKSDTDGVQTFPAYSYDLSGEYGSALFDVRHNLFVGGSITLPWKVRMSPFIVASSGRPFNITTGIDSNRDSLFTERPTYAQVAARCSALGLTYSFCDINGIANPETTIIPRNYGRGPNFFNVNLRLDKTFGFGTSRTPVATTRPEGQQGPGAGGGIPGAGGRRGGGGGGGRGGGGGGFRGGAAGTDKPYNFTLGVQFTNLFNNVNLSPPVGNLNSTRFGQSISTAGGFGFGGGGGGNAGNRRVELQMRFTF